MNSGLLKHYWETTKHKAWVMWYLIKVCFCLIKRGIVHDLSKYKEPEANLFAKQINKLKDTEYGSKEYKELLESIRPAIDHHITINSHHPEFHVNFQIMPFLDKIECLCDWKAASKRHAMGDIKKSIEINQGRFQYSDDEKVALYNDAYEIGLVD